jgi:hypothetical protein
MMRKYIKKTSIFSLISIYFVLVFLSAFAIPSVPVSAAGPEFLCVPPLNELNEDGSSETTNGQSGDNEAERFSPKGGWLSVAFINRATVRITMSNSNGNCQEPSTLKLSAISAGEAEGSFASLIESVLVDVNLDDDFDYRRSQEKNSDEHRLDEIFYPESKKADGKRILALSEGELDAALSPAELILGIEEDSVPSIECSGITNGNFFLIVSGNKPQWVCRASLDGEWRGINVGLATGFSIEDRENFNIVYNVSEDGKTLEHVANKNVGNDSFEWCESNSLNSFRDDCIDGKLEIKGVTPEQLVSQADNERIVLQISEVGGGVIGTSVAAGSNTASANTVLDDGTTGVSGPTCESEGGIFGWVLCPILSWSSQALEVVEGWITNRLDIPPDYYENEGIKGAWERIRNVAYIVLIPVLLVMVISTALGYSFVDAYTVKRALPRLFVAIIFMALSYNIMVLMIEITNDFGRGIGGLIAAPFGGSEDLTLQAIFNPSGSDSAAIVFGGGAVLAGLGIAAISAVSVGVLASYLFVAALALLSIFFVLVFRQMIILGLMVVAPLAIISWIFPGNDKAWKLWWSSFSKLLLLYPIIVAALITGRAFASIVPPADGALDSILTILIKLTAYIAPFFLIPSVFRYAGGAFANLAGIVNNRSKGLFDRNRKYRDSKKAENRQKADNYSRFSDRNRFTKGLNTLTGATRGKNLRGTMRGREGIAEYRTAGQSMQGQEDLKNDKIFQANQNDDNFLVALANRGLAERKLADARARLASASTQEEADEAQADINAREKGLNAAAQVKSHNSAGTRRTALNAWMKTGYNISGGRQGYDEIAETVDSIAGGDMRARSAMMDEAQYHAKSAGHAQLGGINHGNGYDPMAGIKKVGLSQLAGGKTEAIEAMGAEVMANAGPPDDAAALHYQELQAMKSYTTGANRKEVVRQMEALEKRGVKAYMDLPSGRNDPSTGLPATTFERYDTARGNADPGGYGARFSTTEKTAGGKMRAETRRDVAARESRKYEAPDPNRE